MLLIGTVISLLTAVAATRAMLGLLAGFTWFENPQLHGRVAARSAAKWLQIDFMGKRNTWFAISGAIVLDQPSSRSACAGLNLGIDFKGGVQIAFKTRQPTSLADVRAQTAGDRPAATPSSRAAARRPARRATRTSRSGSRS